MAKEFLEFRELMPKENAVQRHLRKGPLSPVPTRRFQVVSKSGGGGLGRITFYPPWRQYIFEPDISTIWSDGCLDQVSEFLKKLKV
jgi:hypothetical protein